MFDLKEIGPCMYVLPKSGKMQVPGLIVASSALIDQPDFEKPLEQVRNVACLPGITGYSIAMPDIHWGYGFPIGGVAAMDPETGVISPGGVGYDINCGVRLALAPIKFSEMKEALKKKLIQRIYEMIPSGVGKGHKTKNALSESDYRNLLEKGASWSVEKGFGFKQDLEYCESHGKIADADIHALSNEAKNRGKDQLGTIGSGNHFVEIGEICEIYIPEIAANWGVELGQTYILIHSGSRGFGHQVCQDALDLFVKKGFAEGLPDRQLVAAPIQSTEGEKYFGAMAAAANFAFNNRQHILHEVRQAFLNVCRIAPEKIRLLYDVCHNIAKFEEHLFNGKAKKFCVHRKGATRAFGPGENELIPLFQKTGQPVLVPGDMGRASHLMAGLGNPLTWCSSCHGAGRAHSRIYCLKSWQGKDPVQFMSKQGVTVMANSKRTIAEEMPDAYKDVDVVVKAVEDARLAKMVAKLKPALILKG